MALGAALADFIYVLVAVYGITNLFSAYKQIIPYILGPGAILMVYIGYRIMRTKFKIDRIEEVDVDPTEKDRRAFYSGFMINFLNPTIFFGWLVSSFIVLSFASSLGFDTGGLNSMVDQNLNEIEAIDGNIKEKTEIPSYLQFDTLKIFMDVEPKPESGKSPNDYPLLTSLFYAFFVAIGSIAWFIILALLFIRFRKQLNINILNLIIRSLGLALCLFGLYFAYMALKFIF
jgi:threonine/homoserine/homoserine lactone efflux protein